MPTCHTHACVAYAGHTVTEAAGSHVVDKSCDYMPLPAPIRRVFYLSSEGANGQEHEVLPQVGQWYTHGHRIACDHSVRSLQSSGQEHQVLLQMSEW